MMNGFLTLPFLALSLSASAIASAADTSSPASVTFNKDVLPILQKNCQSCHRDGQVAPMSFLTWQSTRAWAKALNDRSLSQNEIDTIARWADSGALEGDPKDAPPPVRWADGWMIQPDIVIDGPVTNIPAHPKNDVVEWTTVIIPSGFTKDTWVTSVQIKPEYPAVTHHACTGYVPHQPGVKYGLGVWMDKPRDEEGSAIPEKGPTFATLPQDVNRLDPDRAAILRESAIPGGAAQDCYLPGNFAADYRPLNAAKLIRAGSDIVFVVQ
jgi:hypothetical protein